MKKNPCATLATLIAALYGSDKSGKIVGYPVQPVLIRPSVRQSVSPSIGPDFLGDGFAIPIVKNRRCMQ